MILYGVIVVISFVLGDWPAVAAVTAAWASLLLLKITQKKDEKVLDAIPPLSISYTDYYLGRRVSAPVRQLGKCVVLPGQSKVVLPDTGQFVCAAIWIHAQRSRVAHSSSTAKQDRHPSRKLKKAQRLCKPPRLPRSMQLQIAPLQLQRYLRSCVLAAAHSLVTPPAKVFVDAKTKSRWIDRIFVRVMSGFVARAEVRRQGARCACRDALARSSFASARLAIF
jgi:hypothetical protein